jgi:hypothetical protein
MKHLDDHSLKKTARVAGLLYFLQIPLAVFGILYVPKGLVVAGDFAATAANIISHEDLFRLSIVCAILAALDTVFTAILLYKVLKYVHKGFARMMVLFTALVAPIAMLNELNKAAVLILLQGPEYFSAFSSTQIQTLVTGLLDLHKYGVQISGLFWGLWLLPMGYLVFKSGYIPKIIGILLMLGFVGYMVDFITFFLVPDFGIIVSEYTFLGEVLMVFYLLVKGINVPDFRKQHLYLSTV